MPTTPVPEEMNVYQNAEARFEVAATKLGLEQGITARLAEDKDELIFATGRAPFSLLEGPAA